jgi:hypothetical protein
MNVNGNYKEVRNFGPMETVQGPTKMCKSLRRDQGTMMCREDGKCVPMETDQGLIKMWKGLRRDQGTMMCRENRMCVPNDVRMEHLKGIKRFEKETHATTTTTTRQQHRATGP